MYASFIFLFHIMGPRLSSYHCFSLAHYFLFVTPSSWIFCKKTIEIREQEYCWLHAFWKVIGWRDGKYIFEIKVKLECPRMANVCPDMFGAACRGEFVTINPYSCGHLKFDDRKWDISKMTLHITAPALNLWDPPPDESKVSFASTNSYHWKKCALGLSVPSCCGNKRSNVTDDDKQLELM